jgi:hypothetical protein
MKSFSAFAILLLVSVALSDLRKDETDPAVQPSYSFTPVIFLEWQSWTPYRCSEFGYSMSDL